MTLLLIMEKTILNMLMSYAVGTKIYFAGGEESRLVKVFELLGKRGATSKLATAIAEQWKRAVGYK